MENIIEKRRFLWKSYKPTAEQNQTNDEAPPHHGKKIKPNDPNHPCCPLDSHRNNLIKLIKSKKYSQFRDYLKYNDPNLDDDEFQSAILSECELVQINSPGEFGDLLILIDELPTNVSTIILNSVFPMVRTINHLEFIAECLKKTSPMDLTTWKNIFTATFIRNLPTKRDFQFAVLDQPFLILETLIINRELTVLKACLDDLKSILISETCLKCSSYEFLVDSADFYQDHQDLPYTEGCINKLLLFYAGYSLKVPRMLITPKECFARPQLALDLIDEEAEICMCCLRVKFTTPKGRHPCLRCSRVVRGSIKSPPTRVCKDCRKWNNSLPMRIRTISLDMDTSTIEDTLDINQPKYRILTGNKLTDTELRLNFSYDSIPDAELCLGLLDMSTDDEACHQFLVDQCHKYEDHLRPKNDNFMVDYRQLAKVLQCLALAAKVRGNCDMNWELVISKMEIIKKLVDLNREDLIPREKWDSRESMKRFRNNLQNAELFSIAFNLSITCGFSTHRVLQAWGLHCFRVGNYYLAREKLSHTQTRLMTTNQANRISKALIDNIYPKDQLGLAIQRPKESPQIIVEILKVLEDKYDVEWEEESYYYLFLFGSHRDILKFLMRNKRWGLAFPYILENRMEFEDFLDAVILNPVVEMSEFELVVLMRGSNPSLEKWEPYLSKLCSLYEKKNILENLYNIQASIHDDIRAALTCIKFYSNNCSNYRCFLEHEAYLEKAEFHLRRELKRQEEDPSSNFSYSNRSTKLILERKKIESHMKTIELQRKITKYLVPFEDPFCRTNLLKIVEECSENAIDTPLTMFDHRQLKYLIYLIVSCDEKKGYDLVREILACSPSIDKRSLFHFLIETMLKYATVDKLIAFTTEVRVRSLQGHLVDNCIFQAIKCCHDCRKTREHLYRLINSMQNIHLRISALIASNFLKSAYLLAIESKDYDQLRRISAQAELTGQDVIKRLCEKHLTRYKY